MCARMYLLFLFQFLSRPLDKEYVRLLQDVQADQIPGHIYRGYTILSKDSKNNHSIDLQVRILIYYKYVLL